MGRRRAHHAHNARFRVARVMNKPRVASPFLTPMIEMALQDELAWPIGVAVRERPQDLVRASFGDPTCRDVLVEYHVKQAAPIYVRAKAHLSGDQCVAKLVAIIVL